jgi:hypothetical protein
MAGEDRSNVSVTLSSYEQGIEEYLAHSSPTQDGRYLEFLRMVLGALPADPVLLELGSGPGHDALFFESHGVRVRRTDATKAFVERLRKNGHQAELLDVTADGFGGPVDMVFANAVLLHLTPAQLSSALVKAAAAARLLAFTVKEGDGEAWSTAKLGRPRYFKYWREDAMRQHLEVTGWQPVRVERFSGRIEPWLFFLCERKPGA